MGKKFKSFLFAIPSYFTIKLMMNNSENAKTFVVQMHLNSCGTVVCIEVFGGVEYEIEIQALGKPDDEALDFFRTSISG